MPKFNELPRRVNFEDEVMKGLCPGFQNDGGPTQVNLDRDRGLYLGCLRPDSVQEVKALRLGVTDGEDYANRGDKVRFQVRCAGCVCNFGDRSLRIQEWCKKVDLVIQ